ncbi:MAG: hypothetical protein U0869_18735 [Chloroflexota bacterium]
MADAAATSPEDAVALHARLVAEAVATHGLPLANWTMADLLVRDDTYRRRHGGATLRRRVWTFTAFTGLAVLATVAVLVRLVTGG